MPEAALAQAPTEQDGDALAHVRRATLARIQHFLSAPELGVYGDLKGMCERVSDSYRDRAVVELLQNAHDAHPIGTTDGRIRIAFDPSEGAFGTLYVANDGNGFTSRNFDALCSPTKTTKNVNEAIGNKGVGFLSVFQVSSHPEIYSRTMSDEPDFGGYCFTFAADETLREFLTEEGLGETADQIIANMPRLYLACPLETRPAAVAALGAEGFATVVRLPLKNKDAAAAVGLQLAKLSQQVPPVQLFLSRIRELRVSTSPTEEAIRLERRPETLKEDGTLRLMRVACGEADFVVVERSVPEATMHAIIARDIEAEALPEGWRDWQGNAIVSLAVAAEGDPLASRLYNFLPMGEGVEAPFSGYLDAPIFATLDRLRIQTGVEVNEYLMETARLAAIAGAQAAVEALTRKQARQAVLDLVLWREHADTMRAAVLASPTPLIPTIAGRSGGTGWAKLDAAKIWQGDAFLTPKMVAKHAAFPIVDGEIGAKRLDALRAFVKGTDLLACSVEARADVVEQVAQGLPKPEDAIERWNQFYRSLADLFRSEASALAGRRLLVNARGELKDTEAATRVRRGGRRKRLSAMFLPPLRDAAARDKIAALLPKTVQRRLGFVHEGLEVAVDGSSAARRFLLAGALVREHESREILRLLAGAIADPGETRDPDVLRWEALGAMMRIVTGEDIAEGVVAEINPLVPTREGWSRASSAYFTRWRDTRGEDLDALFERATGISSELDQHARRRLRPYADWQVTSNEREHWTVFLRKAGVSDLLRTVPALAGPNPREWPQELKSAVLQRGNLPAAQRTAWDTLIGPTYLVPNPQTPYTTDAIPRLPGQLDHDALAPVVGREYAEQVVRLIGASPSILRFAIYRPSHPQAPNRREWPSPIAAFVRAAKWIPLPNGSQVDILGAWLPGEEARTPPPLLPLAALEFRQALARNPSAADALRVAGLAEFGTRQCAWRLLTAAGRLVDAETSGADAERMVTAVQDAWHKADLEQVPPADLKVLGRRGGRIVAVDPRDAETRIIVADGDDRQMVAATARAEATTAIVEPPTARAREVGAYLAKHFAHSVRQASRIEASYESDGIPVVPRAEDPTIDEAFGDVIRQIVALSLRYRSTFYRGSLEETLGRLASVRVRVLDGLSLRVGELAEPVPRFEKRAVLIGGTQAPTIVHSTALASTDRMLVGLAPAIGAALGAQQVIGDPLLAFAAELGPTGLSASYEDYAAVLGVPVAEIRGFLGTARASIGNLLRTLRPLVEMLTDETAAATFVVGTGLASESDVREALECIDERLPIPAEDLLRRCRESSDLGALAIALKLDLSQLNRVLARLGPPYAPIDLTERHAATLSAFLSRKAGLLRESIRASFRASFESGDDLASYVATQNSARPTLPTGYGQTEIELDQAQLQGWLDAWMQQHGVTAVAELPPLREQLEQVREANIKKLRALIPELRVAILARAPEGDPIRGRWGALGEAESASVADAIAKGWIDFDRLEDDAICTWLERSGWWPASWPALGAMSITPDERASRVKADEEARIAATVVRRRMDYSGGSFTFGVDAMGSLADHIAGLVGTNATLLNTSSRTMRGEAPLLETSSGGGGRGGGGWGTQQRQMSDDERRLVGFFGEAIAFEWLKRRYGEKRVVNETCWKSGYRRQIFGEGGDDGLGYDFEIYNGDTRWLFEVKSTTTSGPLKLQSLELGSTEFDCADTHKADRRVHYRILYVTDALHPENARIFPLPNPRSRAGLLFFTDRQAGRRLYFPLKP